ncbi:hypothetical protein H5410_053398 [Solanum commersonii]|uniref:Uncharacterized protein n=1 Tax=Solanum commersonii TaxID=4109 RepID=A0A9J5X3R2_SOLCO|nr:hypothetical protein H5410_053398 [Solanum commersonii]
MFWCLSPNPFLYTYLYSPSARPETVTTSSRLGPTLTQEGLIRLGQPPHIIDANMAKFEMQIPNMIKVAVSNIHQVFSNELIGLSNRISRLEASVVGDLTTIKVDVSTLKKELDQMKCTNFDFFISNPDVDPSLVEPLAPTIVKHMEGGQHDGLEKSPNGDISNAETNEGDIRHMRRQP